MRYYHALTIRRLIAFIATFLSVKLNPFGKQFVTDTKLESLLENRTFQFNKRSIERSAVIYILFHLI